ncbi:FitA-like ribbon-helix-helix domain-containing protein [Geodermatophilus sp. SYSU D00766]
MPVSMTIREVPDDTRDELAARAARSGQSLQEYVRAQLIELARRPRPVDFWDHVDHRVRATGSRLTAGEILELRDGARW